MKNEKLKTLLDEFRDLPHETEWVEFKEAKVQMDFNELGEYFSALSNEANLKGKRSGWLVLGVENKKREIVGTRHRLGTHDKLKHEMAQYTTSHITFEDILELNTSEGRVLLFKIPAAPSGIPIAYKGHYYGRDGESLVALNIQEIERIRSQAVVIDWSAQICDEASLEHLSPQAVQKARQEYMKRRGQSGEVDGWDDQTFLNKARITIEGKITRATLLLLGKPEAVHFLSPSPAQISWFLRDEQNNPKDFEHFGPPFILTVDAILNKIRNLKVRFLSPGTLFPEEATQYDQEVIREALHNCLAHQDYTMSARVNIVEKPDEIVFENAGNFIPGSVEAVIEQDSPCMIYRNPFLAQAMVNVRMIETEGGGIKEMFKIQQERFFPLPTYELDDPKKVRVRISGRIIDENYTRVLVKQKDLPLSTAILLDKVQKKKLISREAYSSLKKLRFVEGRYPNIYVSSGIASATGEKAAYIKNRPLEKKYYKDMIMELIKKFGEASRADIDQLIFNKLPEVLSKSQKKHKISNLISELAHIDNLIINKGSDKKPRWRSQ